MTCSTKKRWIVSGAVLSLGLIAITTVAMADYGRGGLGGKYGGSGCNKEHKMDMIRHLDPDGDGKIVIKEAKTTRRETFQKFDANGDGVLGLDEFRKLWMERNERRMVRRFQKFDDNGDGQVSEKDYVDPMIRKMSFMDSNGDGEISRDDRRGHGKYGDRKAD